MIIDVWLGPKYNLRYNITITRSSSSIKLINFDQSWRLQAYRGFEIRLWCRCFSVNLAKFSEQFFFPEKFAIFLRTSFFTANISGGCFLTSGPLLLNQDFSLEGAFKESNEYFKHDIRNSHLSCSIKKLFLKISQYS